MTAIFHLKLGFGSNSEFSWPNWMICASYCSLLTSWHCRRREFSWPILLVVLSWFNGYWNHKLRFCNPSSCHFFHVLLVPDVPSRMMNRLQPVCPCCVVWGLDGGLIASNSYISTLKFWNSQLSLGLSNYDPLW